MGPRCCRVAAVRVWEVGVQGRGLVLVIVVAMTVAQSWHGCNGEGVACVHAREVGVAMRWHGSSCSGYRIGEVAGC